MKKTEYLLEDFKNIQELIRFADTKVAAILVLLGIEIDVFYSITKEYEFTSNITALSIIIFIIMLSFAICMIIGIFTAFVNILKPRFASNYSTDTYSLFYFEHIAKNNKDKMAEKSKIITEEEEQEKELLDQIYECSRILYKKNKYCCKLISVLFLSIFPLVFIVFIQKI